MPVKLYVVDVAPETSVHVDPSSDDCHWKLMLPATVNPVDASVNVVVLLPAVGLIVAVPGVGVPEHGRTPVPSTATFIVDGMPPPSIVTLPLYTVVAVGANLTCMVVPTHPDGVNEQPVVHHVVPPSTDTSKPAGGVTITSDVAIALTIVNRKRQ
jgi:hypothetical protein